MSIRSKFLRRATMLAPPLAIAIFSLQFAFTTPAAAGSDDSPYFVAQGEIPLRPESVRNIVGFESALIADLNLAIRNPEALTRGKAKVVVICDTKIFRDWVDTKAIVVIESARVTQLRPDEIQAMRGEIVRQFDGAIRAELAGKPTIGKFGSGVLQQHEFTGTLRPVGELFGSLPAEPGTK
ncbi:MAG TPA: hypothetical protein VE974_12435 [Thermoanaerobaculia bacterium]|nr:hypothetical protein [Thermoanaerobaculia bacterium]